MNDLAVLDLCCVYLFRRAKRQQSPVGKGQETLSRNKHAFSPEASIHIIAVHVFSSWSPSVQVFKDVWIGTILNGLLACFLTLDCQLIAV